MMTHIAAAVVHRRQVAHCCVVVAGEEGPPLGALVQAVKMVILGLQLSALPVAVLLQVEEALKVAGIVPCVAVVCVVMVSAR